MEYLSLLVDLHWTPLEGPGKMDFSLGRTVPGHFPSASLLGTSLDQQNGMYSMDLHGFIGIIIFSNYLIHWQPMVGLLSLALCLSPMIYLKIQTFA